jgi:serine/threonine protein kinase
MSLPAQVGNYKLEREIGRGSSSVVWLARHILITDQVVAMKVLTSQERETVRRFQREAGIAARLQHPNIVRIYDYGVQALYHYTALEYVPGGSLRELLERRRRLPLTTALTIFRQVAAALDYAHSLGVVHRDVSPGNILLNEDVSGAWLTDFGIARDTAQPITVVHSIMGTPGYLSPEHALSATSVTHLSDLFSLGVVLYQMLSGVLPWAEQTGMPEGPAFGPPLPLRQRGVEGLPAEFDRALARLLALDPTQRFPSAQAAVAEFERIVSRHTAPTQVLTGTPPAARPAPGAAADLQASGVTPNPVELVLGNDLAPGPIDRAHRRAADLSNPRAIADLLDAWSAQGRFRMRRRLLGRLARLHKVSSQNVYFYRLNLLYEQRSPPETVEKPDKQQTRFTLMRELDRWDVELSPVKEFVDDPGGQVTLPGSTRIVNCSMCNGSRMVSCPRCNGKQRIKVMRTVAPAASDPGVSPAPNVGVQRAGDGMSAPSVPVAPRVEEVVVPCPVCEGRGGMVCEHCAGEGRLVQQRVFRWQRMAARLRDHDDLPDIDEARLVATCRDEVVYTERQAGGLRPEWGLVPGLNGLIAQAQERVDDDTRIVLSELTISFIPVTTVVFDLGKTGEHNLYKLFIYGFEQHIPNDWRFLDWERIAAFLAVTFFFLMTICMAFFLAW